MWVTSLWRVLPITLSSQADIPSLTNVVLVERYTFRRLESTHVKSPSSSSSSCLDITPALQQFIHFIVSFTRNSSSPSRTQDTSSNTIISKDNPASPSYFSKQVHAWKHVKQAVFPRLSGISEDNETVIYTTKNEHTHHCICKRKDEERETPFIIPMQRSFSCIRSISKNPTVFKRSFAWMCSFGSSLRR